MEQCLFVPCDGQKVVVISKILSIDIVIKLQHRLMHHELEVSFVDLIEN